MVSLVGLQLAQRNIGDPFVTELDAAEGIFLSSFAGSIETPLPKTVQLLVNGEAISGQSQIPRLSDPKKMHGFANGSWMI